MNRTLFDPAVLAEVTARLRGLTPDSARQWGRMSAPQMVAHLTDQMTHCLGDEPCRPERTFLHWAPFRHLAIYWIPWPKGRIKGPADAFVTRPVDWDTDLGRLIGLVERVAASDPDARWPEHSFFGPMTGRDWGFFCYKHLDHHLRQFGR